MKYVVSDLETIITRHMYHYFTLLFNKRILFLIFLEIN